MTQSLSMAKSLARSLIGRYEYYHVFAADTAMTPPPLPGNCRLRPLSKSCLLSQADLGLRARAVYAGDQALCLGLFVDDALVATQCFWWGARYHDTRNSWPLESNEIKSVDIFTVPEHQGRGFATLLNSHSLDVVRQHGFTTAYSRVWHSHGASIRVQQKSCYRYVGSFVIFRIRAAQLKLLWRKDRPCRIATRWRRIS